MSQFNWDIYAASPLDPQGDANNTAVVEMYRKLGLNPFVPKENGPLIAEMKPEDRGPHVFQAILDANIEGIVKSKMVIACIDNRDAGVNWELGFTSGINQEFTRAGSKVIGANHIKPLLTYSNYGFGANVMISQSVDGHFESVEKLTAFVEENLDVLRNGTCDEIRALIKSKTTQQAATE